MNVELEMLRKLCELTQNTATSPHPKQSFLSWKCPKCGAKLNKKSVKCSLFAEARGNEFANKVVNDNGVPAGFYSFTIEHFIRGCGYEFADRKLDRVDLE